MSNNPSFLIYCLFTTILCINMLGLWGYSGAVRAGTKTTPNPEDVARRSFAAIRKEKRRPFKTASSLPMFSIRLALRILAPAELLRASEAGLRVVWTRNRLFPPSADA